MFERSPFRRCPSCQKPDSFGILSAGGSTVVRRCRLCRFCLDEDLPAVDKKVVYLDQLAISEIFKTKAKSRRPGANNEDFWKEVEREANRTYLLQQVIFPVSNIHRNETIVSPFSSELSLAHEMMSGDTTFRSTDEVNMLQVREFVKAYWEKHPPNLTFNVDHVLKGRRNDWLRDIHITASMDFTIFADRIRAKRDATAAEFIPLYESWVKDKPTFDDALANELKNYGDVNRSTLRYAVDRAASATESLDPLDFIERRSHPIIDQFEELTVYFEERGLNPTESAREISRYWDWPENEQIPTHRISAYLLAALARRIASGQRSLPSRGMVNDINAISAYGPYVDAMFLDNECAQILSEQPLCRDVKLKATIFSSKSGDEFIEYLKNLQKNASSEVRAYAAEIYGAEI